MSSAWPAADRPHAQSVSTRRTILIALGRGDTGPALAGLVDDDERVRATSLFALASASALDTQAATALTHDPSPRVRRALAEAAASCTSVLLDALLVDDDYGVIEVACWAAGERADPQHLSALDAIARRHPDALCRESAVAALGAIGDPAGLDAILLAMSDRATVRRRAVLALAPFDDERVDDALRVALTDRDWQVRQAAEDLA